jgi:hypothetical protein
VGLLRAVKLASAEGWEELLLPEIERQQRLGNRRALDKARPLLLAAAGGE